MHALQCCSLTLQHCLFHDFLDLSSTDALLGWARGQVNAYVAKKGAPGWDGVPSNESAMLLSHLESQACIHVGNREHVGGAALLQVLGCTVGLKSFLITLVPGDRSGHCRYSVSCFGPGSVGVTDDTGTVKVSLSDRAGLFCSGDHFMQVIPNGDMHCIRMDAWDESGSTLMNKATGDFGALVTPCCARRVRECLSDSDTVISLFRPVGYEPVESFMSVLKSGECVYV